MEVPKIDHMFFSSTFRLCDGQAKQAGRAIINIQKAVFQTAECGSTSLRRGLMLSENGFFLLIFLL